MEKSENVLVGNYITKLLTMQHNITLYNYMLFVWIFIRRKFIIINLLSPKFVSTKNLKFNSTKVFHHLYFSVKFPLKWCITPVSKTGLSVLGKYFKKSIMCRVDVSQRAFTKTLRRSVHYFFRSMFCTPNTEVQRLPLLPSLCLQAWRRSGSAAHSTRD